MALVRILRRRHHCPATHRRLQKQRVGTVPAEESEGSEGDDLGNERDGGAGETGKLAWAEKGSGLEGGDADRTAMAKVERRECFCQGVSNAYSPSLASGGWGSPACSIACGCRALRSD